MTRGILLCTTLAVLAAWSPAAGVTFVVDQGGGGDYAEIEPALIVAGGGDTVLVMPGTYTGGDNTNLDFGGKAIVLRSHAGPASTTIDGGGSARAFLFDDGETAATVVEGFTVTNCSGSWGGAVYSFQSSPSIRDCVFSNNTCTEDGGAIYLSGSPATISGCVFSGNSTPKHAGGVMCNFDSDATLTACSFESNSANIGSAVCCEDGSSGALTECTFTGNTQNSVVYCDHSSPSFTDCTFKENTGSYSGGPYLYESVSEFTGCVFVGNVALAGHVGGGALYCDSASPVLLNCTFADNDEQGGGGTIYCYGGSPQLTNAIIAFDGSGPAVDHYVGPVSNPQLVCCDLYGNTGGNWVGVIAGQASLNNNMEVDPEFCDRPLGDLRLYDTSPCVAPNNPDCGQVGALGIGCGTPVEPVSWGMIKSMYR